MNSKNEGQKHRPHIISADSSVSKALYPKFLTSNTNNFFFNRIVWEAKTHEANTRQDLIHFT